MSFRQPDNRCWWDRDIREVGNLLMRSVDIKEHTIALVNKQYACFQGKEAVACMLRKGLATDEVDAVRCGNALISTAIIRAVSKKELPMTADSQLFRFNIHDKNEMRRRSVQNTIPPRINAGPALHAKKITQHLDEGPVVLKDDEVVVYHIFTGHKSIVGLPKDLTLDCVVLTTDRAIVISNGQVVWEVPLAAMVSCRIAPEQGTGRIEVVLLNRKWGYGLCLPTDRLATWLVAEMRKSIMERLKNVYTTGDVDPDTTKAFQRPCLYFTLQGASGLAPADLNGFSDPFCTCTVLHRDKSQDGKWIKVGYHQTKVIDKTLNPEWGMDVRMPLNAAWVGADLKFVLHVWDYDWNQNDFLGEVLLNLATDIKPADDRLLFFPLKPREGKKDKLVQGRLQLRVFLQTAEYIKKRATFVFGKLPSEVPASELTPYVAPIPDVLRLLSTELFARGGAETQGIFRLQPDGALNVQVKRMFNEGEFVEAAHPTADCNVFANLLKVWFRDLPEGILTEFTLEQLEDCKTPKLLLSTLAEPAQSICIFLRDLCVRVALKAQDNKMTANNIGIVFGPNLWHHPGGVETEASKLAHVQHVAADFWARVVQEALDEQ